MVNKINGKYVSIDQILAENNLDKVSDGIPAENFIKANELALPIIINNIQNGIPVIIDGNYHLQVLLKGNHIRKDESVYFLTEEGKTMVSSLDYLSNKIEKQSLIIVMAICVRNLNGQKEFLVHKRKKEPHFDFYTFPEGKTKFGETLEKAVLSELEEETGLKGQSPILKEIKHKLYYKKVEDKREIIRDLIIFVFKIEKVKGKLLNTIEGDNQWMIYDEVKKQDKYFIDNHTSLDLIDNEFVSYTNYSSEVIS